MNGIEVVQVKREGPRGWHWIEAARFDPAVHTLHEPEDQPTTPPPAAKRGKKSTLTEAINGDR